jgi:hypothetical protein
LRRFAQTMSRASRSSYFKSIDRVFKALFQHG